MSRVASGMLVAAVATFAFGAVHLAGATGNNQQVLNRAGDASLPPASQALRINREAKSDRAGAPIHHGSVTLSFKVPAMPGKSFVVRVPNENVARTAPTKDAERPSSKRRTTACEPAVSVLTTIAKQLQPSRCLA